MGEPITLADGTRITGYDANEVEVIAPSGQRIRMARSFATAPIQRAVDAAEGQQSIAHPSVQPAPSAADIAGIGNASQLRPARQAPYGSTIGAAAAPAAEAASQQPERATPINVDPLAGVDARIAQLRAQPQVARVGGGTRTTTQTSRPAEEGVAAALQQQARVEENTNVAEEARGQAALAQAKQAQEMAKLHARQAGEIEKAQRAQADDDARYRQRVDEELVKIEQLTQEAKQNIDPKRWWREKSTGQTILAALSMAMGAYAQGLSRGAVPNTALQIIDKKIQQDIDAQLANRQGKRQEIADRRGILGLVSDKYQTQAEQRKAALIVGRELVAEQSAQIAEQTNDPVIKARALETNATLRRTNAQEAQQLALTTGGNVVTQRIPVAGGAVKSPAAQQADALEKAAFAPFEQEKFIPASEKIVGVPLQAATPEEARNLRNGLARVQVMRANIDKLQSLSKQGNRLSPQDRNQMKAIYSSLTTDLNTIAGLGALSEGDSQFLKDQLGPSPADFTTVSPTLDRVASELRARVRAELANKTFRVSRASVPASQQARYQQSGLVGGSGGPPQTRPLGEPQ